MNNTTTGKKARPRSFRLSDDEWAEIEKRATKAGISTSKWIRAALLDYLEMDGKKPQVQVQAVSMPQMPPDKSGSIEAKFMNKAPRVKSANYPKRNTL